VSSPHGQRLLRTLKRTCLTHGLLAEGDRILVAVSGGKDSYTMLELLHQLVPTLPFAVELLAVHLDQRQPGYDGRPLVGWLEGKGYPFEILSEDTYSAVVAQLNEESTYCSLCSRLRRGILYTAAERLGCNKLALGHHREDAIHTFLLNLLYQGKLQAMPAKYLSDDGKLEVIRPLIECEEPLIIEHARSEAYPILPCNLCGSQRGLKRVRVAALVRGLEQEIPDVRSVMSAALANVVPTHLLDTELLAAWQARPKDVRPKAKVARRPAKHAALPVVTARRLPLLAGGSERTAQREVAPPPSCEVARTTRKNPSP
jgi:tRNA 2-thiocytidine biosynthesis protein TtcA